MTTAAETGEASRGLRLSPTRRPRLVYALVAAGPIAYTVAIVLHPSWQVTWFSADARVLTAVSGFWLSLMAAGAVQLQERDGADPSHSALVAALFALAVTHLVMLVGFVLVPTPDNIDVAAVYGWLVARYLSSLLFIGVALRWPRLRVRTWTLVIVALVGLAIAVCFPLAPWLPQPFATTTEGLAVINRTTAGHVTVSAVPAVLYAIGTVLVWRLFRRRDEVTYFWLSLALLLQALSKAHEVVYRAAFGPVLTTADVLVVGMLVLLLAVALSGVRSLSRDRAEAVASQDQDLGMQSEMLGAMAAFTEREEVFRSVVTHEVGTPLAAIRAYAHVVCSPNSTAEQVREAADGIDEQARRLNELTDRMDELRSLDTGEAPVSPRPLHLAPLLEEASRFGRALPGGHDVAVVCDGVPALVDPVRFGQALRNLVSNAVRYSPPGTLILIECRRTDDAVVEVSVTDDGPGIPAQDRERVLGRFERGRNRAPEGSGLGLYIARRITEAHGGRIRVDAGPAGGARVVMEFKEASS